MKEKLKKELLPYLICMVPAAAGILLLDGGWRLVLGILLLVLTVFLIVRFAEIVKEFTPSREEENQEDAQWFRQQQEGLNLKRLNKIGIILDCSSCVLILGTILFFDRGFLWVMGCICCTLASVSLAVKYPGYFTLMERAFDRQKRCGCPSYSLMFSAFVPIANVALAFSQRYGTRAWGEILFACAVFTIGFSAVFIYVLPELRRKRERIGAVILAALISLGSIVSLNYLLDFHPTQVQMAIVEKTTKGSQRSSPTVFVVFPDGTGCGIPIGYEQYHSLQTGDRIAVECHVGGLGIEFYNIA